MKEAAQTEETDEQQPTAGDASNGMGLLDYSEMVDMVVLKAKKKQARWDIRDASLSYSRENGVPEEGYFAGTQWRKEWHTEASPGGIVGDVYVRDEAEESACNSLEGSLMGDYE